jgi:hypothetical protein
MKKISLFIVLAVLLMLAMPVTAQLPVCSDTVLTIEKSCIDNEDPPYGIWLRWTAQNGAAGYSYCENEWGCNERSSSMDVGGLIAEGDYTFWITAYDEAGYPLCESNKVPVKVPFDCTQPAPEFPTMLMPIAMIIGVLGTVLFIQRTREN